MITLIEKAFFLKKTELFSELDLDLVLAIADKAQERKLTDSELIFSCNQDAHCLYVIVSGKVVILDDEDHPLATLSAPDFFGDESLFNRQARSYSTKAQGETVLILISRTHLIESMLECPQVGLAMIKAYAGLCTFRKRHLDEKMI